VITKTGILSERGGSTIEHQTLKHLVEDKELEAFCTFKIELGFYNQNSTNAEFLGSTP
jgi:hypothetical protein